MSHLLTASPETSLAVENTRSLGDSGVKVPTHLPLIRSLLSNISPNKICNTEVLGGMGDTDRAPDSSHCIGRTCGLISGTSTPEGSMCLKRRMRFHGARVEGKPKSRYMAIFSQSVQEIETTDRHSDRHCL